MRRALQWLLVAAWAAVGARGSERSALWRVFPAGEGAGSYVSVAPRGRMIVKHADETAITILDGYTRRQMQLPEEAKFRVYESRAGQLWVIQPEGLWMFQRGQWARHNIADIRQEYARPFRQNRPIALAPAEVNRVLVLLTDKLIEYDALTTRASVVKLASQTGLGTFYEMSETAEGGLLISGANGLARVQGPLRQLGPSTPWTEYLNDGRWPVDVFQRPFEGPNRGVISAGIDRNQSTTRYVFEVGSGGWRTQQIDGERVRAAWAGWNDSRWGFSFNSIVRLTGNTNNPYVRETAGDTYFDIAVQTNGVFWAASSAGAIRYAPLLWQTPEGLRNLNLPESSALAVAQGDQNIWVATTDGLLRVGEGGAERIAWPDDFENSVQGVESIYEMPSGEVVIGAVDRVFAFEPTARKFAPLRAERMRALGRLQGDALCVRMEGTNQPMLARYDGTFSPMPQSLGSAPALLGEIYGALETRGGDLFLAGGFGIARFRRGVAEAEVFGLEEGVPERIYCVAEVGDDRIWAGGADAVFELRRGRWETVRAGLERVRAIYRARDGVIWIASARGVHRVAGEVWVSNAEEEGLPSSVVAGVIEDRRGRIWAATGRGVVEYGPEGDPDAPRTLPPTIIAEPEEGPGATRVVFAGADKWNYTPTPRLMYAYRLDEGPWSAFTNVPSILFRNLAGGPHYIQVRAMDRNGNDDPTTATLEFAVTMPWFKDPRLIAVTVFGLAAILFLAGIAVNRHLRLVRSYAEVERMVAERTAQLEKANQELLHSQKMRALGTLAAGIAHDFNNILSIIKGSAQIIEANAEDKEKVLTRANRIQTVVEQGAGIVRSMLGLGKMGDQSDCSLGEIVDEAIRLYADRLPAEVELRHEREMALPQVNCSKAVIHQILLNLILNAVDACGGKGPIVVRTRSVKEPGQNVALQPNRAERYVAIDVIDHGSGISHEVLPRIFEPFYTTKAFSSRRGTGLGLSMVYELAKGMGYGLAVKSEPGAGSTFTLLAPAPALEQKASAKV